ncbi:MAG: Membrane transport protein [Lentisphaerae bacterium ADurb.Bin242]|nr:MAG: Membrane transport protein [Lentisphaerae bacterium ADurb.Bin242]
MDIDMIVKVILAIVKTFFFFGIGALALRLKMFGSSDLGPLGRFAIDLLMPFFTFYSIVTNFGAGDAKALWQLPLLGFGIMLFGMLCGYGLQYGMRNRTPRRAATFIHLATVNNYAFLPLILLESLFGMKAVAYLFLMNVGSAIGFWTCGIFALVGGGDLKQTVRNILSTNIAAVALALLVVFTGIRVPGTAMSLCKDVGVIAVPLALILTGAAIFSSGSRLMAYRYDAIYTLLTRLVILPLLTIFVLKLFPLDPLTRDISIVVSLMPASCASALIVKKYGGCADLAGQSIFISTIASIVTIPVFLCFLM